LRYNIVFVVTVVLNMLLPSLSYTLWSLGARPYDAVVTPVLLLIVQIVSFRAARVLTIEGAPLARATLEHMRRSTFCAHCGALYDIDHISIACPNCDSDLRSRRAVYYYSSSDHGSPMSLLSIYFARWFIQNLSLLVWFAVGFAAYWLGWLRYAQFLDDAGYGIPMPL